MNRLPNIATSVHRSVWDSLMFKMCHLGFPASRRKWPTVLSPVDGVNIHIRRLRLR